MGLTCSILRGRCAHGCGGDRRLSIAAVDGRVGCVCVCRVCVCMAVLYHRGLVPVNKEFSGTFTARCTGLKHQRFASEKNKQTHARVHERINIER